MKSEKSQPTSLSWWDLFEYIGKCLFVGFLIWCFLWFADIPHGYAMWQIQGMTICGVFVVGLTWMLLTE